MPLALASWVEAAKQWFAPFVMIPEFFGTIPGMPKEVGLLALAVLAAAAGGFFWVFHGIGRLIMAYVFAGSVVTAYWLIKGLL